MTNAYRILPTDTKGFLNGIFFELRDVESNIIRLHGEQRNQIVDNLNDGQRVLINLDELITSNSVSLISSRSDKPAAICYSHSHFADSMTVAEVILKEKWKSLLERMNKHKPIYLKMKKYFNSKNFEKAKHKLETSVLDFLTSHNDSYQQDEVFQSLNVALSYNHLNSPKLSVYLRNLRNFNAEIYCDQLTIDRLKIVPALNGNLRFETSFLVNNITSNTTLNELKPFIEYFYSRLVEYPDELLKVIDTLESGFNYSNVKITFME